MQPSPELVDSVTSIPASGISDQIGRILIVDDNDLNLAHLEAILLSSGHEVTTASNGLEAIDQVANAKPDLLLMDVMMPVMDGLEACRTIKTNPETRHLPVILVTSLDEQEDRLEGISAGANDFLTKPVDPRDVKLRVRNALYTKRLFDQVQENLSRLQNLERMKENLTHMIIHDLRSPLSGLSGNLQMLQMKKIGDLDPKVGKLVDRSSVICKTLINMVTSMLDVSQLEANEMPVVKTPQSMTTIAEAAVSETGGLAQRVNLQLDIEEAEINCDQNLIRRVITNLLSNAIRYSPENADLLLQSLTTDEEVLVEVIDSGPGIPEGYREKIFEKFGQVEGREQFGKYSTGLGLTYCKLAVESHQGSIGVRDNPAGGSIFWFKLPLG